MEALIASYGDSSSDSDSDSPAPPPPPELNNPQEPTPALPPPPLSLLDSPNFFGFLDFSPSAQPSRVRNFAHVEGNYAVHVYIPVYIPPAPRKEMALFLNKLASLVPGLHAVDVDVPLDILRKDEHKLEHVALGREFHISLGRTVPIRVHQIDSLVTMLRQKLQIQRRYWIDFSKWEVFVNDDQTRTFVSIEVIAAGLAETTLISWRGDVVKEMVLACPESLEDVTLHEETSLHLAINNCQFEAVKTLVESAMELRKDNVLNMKDKNGNSVLHVATWKKQRQVVEWLVGNGTTPSALEVNIVNQSGLTPLDLLLIFPSEAGDREIEEILRGAGASRAQDIGASRAQDMQHTLSHGPMETNTLQLQQPNNPMEYFKFKMGRDSPSDARTALLVIAVLVATTTFQAGLSPPMGIWQDSPGSNMNGTGSGSNEPAHTAGQSIMSSYNILGFYTFYVSNSIGLLLSLYMIHVLTTDFPLRVELTICMFAMMTTYAAAISGIGPVNNFDLVLALILVVLIALVALVRVWYEKHGGAT